MSTESPYIGIDFGTTYSSMAWFNPEYGRAEIILNAEGENKTPSIVYYGRDEVLVGKPAESAMEDAHASLDEQQRQEIFQRTQESIKRKLLDTSFIALPGRRPVRPAEVAAKILEKLKGDAQDRLFHKEISRAVITHPAEFDQNQQQKIKEAAELAGFSEVELLSEPVAGALAYTREGLNVGKHVMVYDLGGGTFDLAVLNRSEDDFYWALEPKGLDRCGGDDFDWELYSYCDKLAREKLGRPIGLEGHDKNFLRDCRSRKVNLSTMKESKFSSYLSSHNGPVRFEHKMSRETFDGLIRHYVEDTMNLVKVIAENARNRDSEVDTTVLIGGSSRVPAVQRRLRETLQESLGISFLEWEKQDLAVTLGAAYHAEKEWGTRKPSGGGGGGGTGDSSKVPGGGTGSGDAVVESDIEPVRIPVRLLHTIDIGTAVRSIAMSPDGQLVVSGEESGRIRLWDVNSGSIAGELLGHKKTVRSLAISTEGSSVVSGGSDRSIKLWQIEGWKQCINAVNPGWASGRVLSVAASHSRGVVISGDGNGKIRLWDASSGTPRGELPGGHSRAVRSLAMSPDGSFLASASDDRTVRLWSMRTQQSLDVLSVNARVLSVAISSKGHVVTGDAVGKVKVWGSSDGASVESEILRNLPHEKPGSLPD